MRILMGHRGWAMGIVLLAGCAAGGGSTQLPSVAANSPDQERAGYQLHDPLPEYDTGPFGSSGRPRGFDVSRATPRKAEDKWMPTAPFTGRAQVSSPARTARVVQP